MKILHDHARHLGKEFVNAHDFVTLAVAFPIRDPADPQSVKCFMALFACRMYQPAGASKLKMAAELAERALKIVGQQQHIIF